MRRYPHYTYLSLTTREAGRGAQGLHSGSDNERPAGNEPGPAARPGADARLPVRQPEDDRRAGEGPRDRGRVYPQPPGVIEMLEERGFQADQANIKFKGNIHFEEYW